VIAIVDLWVNLAWRPIEGKIERDTELRRLVVMLDFVRVVFKGIVQDELLVRGFAAVNDEEFSGWLKRHGALEITLTRFGGHCGFHSGGRGPTWIERQVLAAFNSR